MNVVDLLVTLNKLPPQAWDAVIPHSHRQWVIENRLESVGLNPQPLPPVEIATSAAISVAQDLVRAGSIAESIGHGGSSLIAQEIEDWCGTGWPRHWPFPVPPTPDPDPRWNVADAQFVASLVLAEAAGRMAEGDLRDALTKGAEQLMDFAGRG